MLTRAILLIGALAILIATFLTDARLTPVVGAFILFAAIIYGYVRNKTASDANYRKAERATRRQKQAGYSHES